MSDKTLDLMSALTVLAIVSVSGTLILLSVLKSCSLSEANEAAEELVLSPTETLLSDDDDSASEQRIEGEVYQQAERLMVQQEEMIHNIDAIRAYLQDEQAVRNGELEKKDFPKLDQYLAEDLPESVYHQQQQRQE